MSINSYVCMCVCVYVCVCVCVCVASCFVFSLSLLNNFYVVFEMSVHVLSGMKWLCCL